MSRSHIPKFCLMAHNVNSAFFYQHRVFIFGTMIAYSGGLLRHMSHRSNICKICLATVNMNSFLWMCSYLTQLLSMVCRFQQVSDNQSDLVVKGQIY